MAVCVSVYWFVLSIKLARPLFSLELHQAGSKSSFCGRQHILHSDYDYWLWTVKRWIYLEIVHVFSIWIYLIAIVVMYVNIMCECESWYHSYLSVALCNPVIGWFSLHVCMYCVYCLWVLYHRRSTLIRLRQAFCSDRHTYLVPSTEYLEHAHLGNPNVCLD